jgi:DNA-binding FadR family transcriptional regulator
LRELGTMIFIPLSHLAERAQGMPEGYLAEVLEKGSVKGDALEIADEQYHALIDKYSPEPSLAEMAANFTQAVARWVKAGFPVTTEKAIKSRKTICHSCEHHRPDALVMKCAKCGCAKVKIWLATERCPIGKW